MYFAIAPTSPILPSQIAQEIGALIELHAGAPLHVIALVDGAFDERFFDAYPRSYWPRHSLYANTSLQGLGAEAPQPTPFGHRSVEMEKWLESLFSQCSGKPMLSIIASAMDTEALKQHLRPYLICRTEDTLEWPVRWGDSRILPGLMELLPIAQHTHLMAPVYRWWTVGRSGEILGWNGEGKVAPAAASFDKLPMDDSTFATLVDRSEVDAILSSIHDSQPDLLSGKSPVWAHETVSRNLDVATSYRVEGARARQHFSVLALMISGDLTEYPGMAEALNRVRSGSQYFYEIAKLPESFWDAAEEVHS